MDKCEDIDEEFPHFHSQIRDRKRFIPIKISDMILNYCEKGEIINYASSDFQTDIKQIEKSIFSPNFSRATSFHAPPAARGPYPAQLPWHFGAHPSSGRQYPQIQQP